MLVQQVIRQSVSEKPALYINERVITYGELRDKVQCYRDFFYQQGVRQGDNVGLFAKNSPEFIYTYFAVISLGAVIIPLNFQFVPREIAYIVKDAGMNTLVTMNRLNLSAELVGYGYEQELKQLVIPEFDPGLSQHQLPEAPAAPIMQEEDICVIIYTSGTTGNPKGAMLSHYNLFSDAKSFTDCLGINAEDNSLCVLPMYHCFAWTCAVLGALLQGGAVTIVENFVLRDTIATIRAKEVTVTYAVPAMYSLFAAWATAEDFAKVRMFVSGGATLPVEIARKFTAKIGQEILEGYGLSEASPVVSVNRQHKVKAGSIGTVIPGVSVKIADENGADLPIGEVGELLVQGPNVMSGYYNLPEESAKALRNGWLHTGDLARLDEEGYIYIVDRLKDMIITGGENIYPREIEELLYAHPAVAEAAVVGIPDKLRGHAARAYLVAAEGHTLDVKDVRAYLQTKLAAYKVPKEFSQVQNLPKNSTGKILKRVLREQAE